MLFTHLIESTASCCAQFRVYEYCCGIECHELVNRQRNHQHVRVTTHHYKLRIISCTKFNRGMTLLGSTIAKLLILQAQSVKWFEMCPLFCVFVVCPHISHVCLCYSHMFRLNVHLKLCFVLAFKVKLQSILFPYVFSHLLYP